MAHGLVAVFRLQMDGRGEHIIRFCLLIYSVKNASVPTK